MIDKNCALQTCTHTHSLKWLRCNRYRNRLNENMSKAKITSIGLPKLQSIRILVRSSAAFIYIFATSKNILVLNITRECK